MLPMQSFRRGQPKEKMKKSLLQKRTGSQSKSKHDSQTGPLRMTSILELSEGTSTIGKALRHAVDDKSVSSTMSRLAGGASGSAAAELVDKEAAMQLIKDMQLSCGTEDVTSPASHARLRRGEVEFGTMEKGGHRAHYLIAPSDMEDADEILRWMFVRQEGWRLQPPNLLLSCYGGRDHYVNWAESKTLLNKEAWDPDPDQAHGVGSSMRRTMANKKLVKAEPARQPAAYELRKKFTSRLAEISAGVCQAVTECGGWFDLGTGKRGGLNEVLMDGLKVYWSAFGCLAGHKTGSVVFCIRLLQNTEFAEQFENCSEEVPTASEQVTQLQKRVMYPAVTGVLFPELGKEATSDLEDDQDLSGFEPDSLTGLKPLRSIAKQHKEVRAQISTRFLCNALTHIIFVRNQQVLDRLRNKLRSLATRAVIFANGNPTLIEPGIEGKILMEAMAGVPVVCLHNTGACQKGIPWCDLNPKSEPLNPKL